MKKLTSYIVFGLVLIFAFGTATGQDMMYGEAPMLAALVEAGELPPVEERLPAEPLVITPVERIGDYGGQWRSAMVGGLDHIWMIRLMAYENLIRFTPDWSGLMPGVAKSFSGNAEATEFTFELREGLRWSDGAPYTADDITFWYDDVLTNEDLTPTIATWLDLRRRAADCREDRRLYRKVHFQHAKWLVPAEPGLNPRLRTDQLSPALSGALPYRLRRRHGRADSRGGRERLGRGLPSRWRR